MALTATISLNTASVQVEQKVNATVTISNDDVVPVSIVDIRPTCRETSDSIPEDASSCALVSCVPLSPSTNSVPASGSAVFTFSLNVHAPSGSGTYDVSCQISAADGQNVVPTPATLTVIPVLPVF